jgi:hypothetical protein
MIRAKTRGEPLISEAHRSAIADETRATGAGATGKQARAQREEGACWGKTVAPTCQAL